MRRIALGVCRKWASVGLPRALAVARYSTTALLLDQSSQQKTGNLAEQLKKNDASVAAADNLDTQSSSSPVPPAAGQTAAAPISTSAAPKQASKGGLDEKEDISITGPKGEAVAIQPAATFADLANLPGWLADGVRNLGFTTPSVIQKFTIPALQSGHDIIGLAPTGSGKTVAFAIPALQHVESASSGSPSVLVLAPTRELVQQTTKVFEKLSQGRVHVAEAYGGTPREIQARRLHRGCDVLVACPGRLKDFLDSGDVSLSNLSFLVFDEADRLLDMGFQIQLDGILAFLQPSQKVQRMMWSATWPDAVQDLARTYLSPERLLIRAGTVGTGAQVNEHIRQRILFADNFQDRVEKLVGLIESGELDENTAKLIIFVERQSDTEEVAHSLSRRLGIDSRYVGVIHGGLSQRRRDSVMNDFKRNHVRLLVATDVASRGLDIPDVTCVVNFQAPQNIDSYCHRIGRTGRAGRHGDAFTFLGRQDGGIATELIDYLRRCKMEVPAALSDLEARHIEESRARGRFNRGGGGGGDKRYNRNNSSNYNRRRSGSEGRFSAPSWNSSNNSGGDRTDRSSYGSQHNYQRRERDSFTPEDRKFGSQRQYTSASPANPHDDGNGWM